jgi:putative molybdopterin biosynthesis protein
LLQAIGVTGSLAAALAQPAASRIAAWGLLRDQQRRLGASLVVLERGRGARRAPAGAKLVSGQRAAEQRLARILPGLAVELAGRAPEPTTAQARLSVAASHDPALAALRDGLPAAARLSLELAFMGSLHALEQFAARRVDIAGFHIDSSPHEIADLAPFLRLLHPRRDRLIRFVDRDQGFILPRGSPARVGNFRDVARKRLRAHSAARSGTRLLIDRLLADEGVEASSIPGYANGNSRTPPWRRRSPRAPRTPASVCARRRPSTDWPSCRACASGTTLQLAPMRCRPFRSRGWSKLSAARYSHGSWPGCPATGARAPGRSSLSTRSARSPG